MIGREEGDKLEAEQIVVECRRFRGPVLVHGTGRHRAQRIAAYGFPTETVIAKKWRLARRHNTAVLS